MNSLEKLIQNKELRNIIASNAYEYCLKKCTTMYTGYNLVSILKKVRKKLICIGFAKLEMSGGAMVALRHATILQDAGYQVNLLSYYDTSWLIVFV